MPASRVRTTLRNVFLLVAALAALSGFLLIVFGGFDADVLGVRIAAHDPLRSFTIAGVALAMAALGHGIVESKRAAESAGRRLNAQLVVFILALVVALIGVAYASTVAGGPDPYGYVSQAGLWIDGDLRADLPVMDAPWPNAPATWAPLGYVPADHGGVVSIVPVYAPGLPLLMAAARSLGGQEAIFWIVPICGALLVFWTYRIGVRFGTPAGGCIAALLVATSPVFMVMLVQPMSDLPVAAAWAISIDALFGGSMWSAFAAGAACTIAVLIRPNLAPLAFVLGSWFIGRAIVTRTRSSFASGAIVFAAAAAPGFIAVATINQFLYGSPFLSGYGSVSTIFHLSNVLPNTANYITWLAQSHTPAVLLGVVALFIPVKRLWPGLDDNLKLLVAALFVVVLWALYLPYLQFTDWPFLRYLLPSWPLMMVGLAVVVLLAWRSAPPLGALAALWVIGALCLFGLRVADRGGAFAEWQSARRYVDVARQVRSHSGDDAVVIALLHSGSLRYYGGRLTLRYDQLDRDWLDRSVAWLGERGMHVYALLEPWELADFRQRFAGQHTLERLDESVVFVYHGPNVITFHDLTGPIAVTEHVQPASDLRAFRSIPPFRP